VHSALKIESASVVVLATCIFLTFYFTLLSFQTAEEAVRRQLVTLAAYTLISGAVILAIVIVHVGIKKALSHVGEQLKRTKEPSENEQT
jgi:NADH:ubiquinone oxidoreductase subunit 6 (subunit J)